MLQPPLPPYSSPSLGELHGLARLLARTADRLAARTFAAGRLGPDCLPRLHGQWQQAEEIDFSRLPSGFALKASRGHASSHLVLARDQTDIMALRRDADRWLAREPGQRPRLFAEELLLARNGDPALAWRFRLSAGRLEALSDAPPDRRLATAAARLCDGLADGMAEGIGSVRVRLHLVDGRVVFGSISRE